MNKPIVLSAADRMIIASYHSVLDGLAEFLGGGFEFVLHNLENLDSSAVKVINGHHSNREVGAPITDLALRMLSEIQNHQSDKNRIYNNRSRKGSPIRAATLPICGEGGRIIGLICINFYMDIPLNEFLSSWFQTGNEDTGASEALASNAEDLIALSIADARSSIYNNGGVANHNKNRCVIEHLYHKGIFRLKSAVPKVADMMGISPNTVYLHLRKLRKDGTSGENNS